MKKSEKSPQSGTISTRNPYLTASCKCWNIHEVQMKWSPKSVTGNIANILQVIKSIRFPKTLSIILAFECSYHKPYLCSSSEEIWIFVCNTSQITRYYMFKNYRAHQLKICPDITSMTLYSETKSKTERICLVQHLAIFNIL